MLANCNIISFVASTDLERSRAFYHGVLGLEFVADEHIALVFQSRGQLLRVTRVETFEPATHTVLGWSVPDIAAAVDELGEKGVEFTFFDGMDQDDRGIWTSPSGAKIAWFDDPDGNNLSLTQFT